MPSRLTPRQTLQPGLEYQRRQSARGGAGDVAQHVEEAARAAGVVDLEHFHAGGKPQGDEQCRIERHQSSIAPDRRQECRHAQRCVERQVDGDVAQDEPVDFRGPPVEQHPQWVGPGTPEIEMPGVERAVDDQRYDQDQQTVH